MYSINKKVALIAAIAIGDIGFVAAGRTLQQSGMQQQTTSGPQASDGREIHGTPGSPNATETIDGRYLPAPDPPFRGQVNVNAAQSKPYWPPRVVPPKDAPNILLIITDDVGFGAPSSFGGVIPTPTLDRIASNELRYTNFHSTPLCSPTRAALLTGRNHHSVGYGVVAEQSTGFEGYNSIIPSDSATIGRILLDNGYRTAWFGKDHNTPEFQASQAGPFPQWPRVSSTSTASSVATPANGSRMCRNTTAIYPYVSNPHYKSDHCDGRRRHPLDETA